MTSPDSFSEEALEKLWQDALVYMKQQGVDTDKLLAEAAANLTYWHDHPSMDTEHLGVDDAD